MKKILTTLLCCFFGVIIFAQQEQQYTQFFYNKPAYNPGFTGSEETACFTGIIRSQWIGLAGALKLRC